MSDTEKGGDLYYLPVRKVGTKIRLSEAPSEYIFTGKQHQFFDTFSRTLDKELALKEAGLKWNQIADNPYVLAEIKQIQEAGMYRHRANATVGNHHRLMDKIEDLMDRSGDMRVKQSFAGVLARMSDTALKQAGEMQDDSTHSGVVGVQVNLFLGGRPEETPKQPLTIEVNNA